jgi:protoporphyrinogen/coproporphyrinogen III oxidase
MATPPAPVKPSVAVIGAGIAGLAAGWTLNRAGVSVEVFESNSRVGGRIVNADGPGGSFLDVGANFISSEFRVIPALVKAAGLEDQLCKAGRRAAIILDGKVHLLHADRPWTFFTSGLLTVTDAVRLGAKHLSHARRDRKRDPTRLDDWADLDEVPNDSFLKDPTVVRLMEPALNAFCFQDPGRSSQAFLRGITSGKWGYTTFGVRGGFAQLPLRLAAGLNVHTSCAVDRVTEEAGGVWLQTSSGRTRFDRAILTVPANQARAIYVPRESVERTLLQTEYSKGGVLAVKCREGWRLPRRLRRLNGIAVGPREPLPFAGMTFEINKFQFLRGEQQVNVYVNSDRTPVLDQPDQEAVNTLLAALESLLPGIREAASRCHLQRWPHALPLTPVGRAIALRDYWSQPPADRLVWLAGDYMGFPSTDSAAASGVRTAEAIVSAAGIKAKKVSDQL